MRLDAGTFWASGRERSADGPCFKQPACRYSDFTTIVPSGSALMPAYSTATIAVTAVDASTDTIGERAQSEALVDVLADRGDGGGVGQDLLLCRGGGKEPSP